MTVDLSKLKAGDTVHFRCGGSAEVKTVKVLALMCPVEIELKGSTHGSLMWFKNGCFDEEDSSTDPFDIIRIEPKPFDWKDAKPGMGFYRNGDKRRIPNIYIGPNFGSVGQAGYGTFFRMPKNEASSYKLYSLSDLTRAPEFDIEVPE